MKGKRWFWGIGAIGLLFAGLLVWWLVEGLGSSQSGNPPGEAPGALNQRNIERSRALYLANCSQCHGTEGEGQPNWRQRNPDGTFLAPPHDSTGHTWHHGDSLLFRIIQDGGKVYEDPGFKSMMPAFGDMLSSEEIRAVITYLKSLWDANQRDSQAEVSRQDPFP